MTKDIPKEIRAIILAMSYDRNTFKNRVGEKIGGAFLEFCKARLARKIGKMRWVTHWESEVKELLYEGLMYILRHKVKGCKNKRKAVNEVIEYIKSEEVGYKRSAEYVVKKDYGLVDLRVHLNNKDIQVFWDQVEEIVNISLL